MTLLKVVIVLVLCLVAVGFYQEWFVLASREGDDEGGQIEVNLTVDPEKALDDAKAIGKQARELTVTSDDAVPADVSAVDTPDETLKKDVPSEVLEEDINSRSLEEVVQPEND